MRRVLMPSLGAVALVGALAAALVVAPCAPSFAALGGFGFGPAHCAGPRATEASRAVAPPTVTVVAAVDRPFVDRLFVSGTLVAREEAQVAAQIDGLTIAEIDAEEGDSVAAGQLLARLDHSQIDAQIAQNDAATGGLAASTLLSLVFVPAVFTLIDDLGRLTWRIFARFVGETDEAAHHRPAAEPESDAIDPSALPSPAE